MCHQDDRETMDILVERLRSGLLYIEKGRLRAQVSVVCRLRRCAEVLLAAVASQLVGSCCVVM